MARKTKTVSTRMEGILVALYAKGEEEGREPPTEFRLFSKGINRSTKGDFLFDEEAAQAVMEEYEAHGVDLSIDYDHAAVNGGGARVVAAGWFKLEMRDGDLWAVDVKWTPAGAEHLRQGEYRYFSPLFNFDPDSGRIQKIVNSALTNTPALHGIDALVAASATAAEDPKMEEKLEKALNRIKELEDKLKEKDEEMKALKAKASTSALSVTVGLSSTASEDQVRSQVAALVTFRKEVTAIAGKDSDEAALGALTAMKERAVEADALRQRVEAAEIAALSAEFGKQLDNLSTAGKDGKFLPPAAREKAEALAKDLGGGKLTKAGVDKAMSYVDGMLVSGTPTGGTGQKGGQMALSSTELDIARRTGSDPKKLLEYKAKKLAAEQTT